MTNNINAGSVSTNVTTKKGKVVSVIVSSSGGYWDGRDIYGKPIGCLRCRNVFVNGRCACAVAVMKVGEGGGGPGCSHCGSMVKSGGTCECGNVRDRNYKSKKMTESIKNYIQLNNIAFKTSKNDR